MLRTRRTADAGSSSSPAARPLVYAVEMAEAAADGDAGAHGARPVGEHARAALAVGAPAHVGQRPSVRHRAATHRARGARPAHGGRRRRPRRHRAGHRRVAARLGRPARGPGRGRPGRGGGASTPRPSGPATTATPTRATAAGSPAAATRPARPGARRRRVAPGARRCTATASPTATSTCNDVWVTPDGRAVLRGFDGAAIAASDRDLALDRAQLLVSTALVHGRHGRGRGGRRRHRAGGGHDGGAVPATAGAAVATPVGPGAATRRCSTACARPSPRPPASSRHPSPASTASGPAPPCRWRPSWSPSTCCCPSSATSATRSRRPASANWWWLAPMILGAAATIVFAALSFVASVPEPIPFLPGAADADRLVVPQPHRPGQHRHAGGRRALPAAVRASTPARRRPPSGCRRWRASWCTWP